MTYRLIRSIVEFQRLVWQSWKLFGSWRIHKGWSRLCIGIVDRFFGKTGTFILRSKKIRDKKSRVGKDRTEPLTFLIFAGRVTTSPIVGANRGPVKIKNSVGEI
jgi:hypothetical protein